jgi:ligand-binding sensor domain-containing protein/signal transduction histidine kinase
VALTRWTLREGLPDNEVTSVVPGADGYLWIATRSGVSRFDGYRFVSLSPERQPLLSGDAIKSMVADGNGALWCATKRGVARIQEGRAFLVRETNGLAGPAAGSVRPGSGGSVWVAGDRGVTRILEGRTTAYTNLPAPNTSALAIEEMPDGRVFVGLQTGLFNLDTGTGAYTRAWSSPAVPEDSDPPMVRHLCLDDEGVLWIAGNFGIYQLRNGRIDPLDSAPLREVASVSGLFHEPGNGIWVFAGHRVFHQPREGGGLRPAFELPKFSGVRCFSPGADGSYWIGTDRAGLFRATLLPAESFGSEAGFIHPEVHATAPRRKGGVWLATEAGLHAFDQRKVVESIPASAPGPRSLRTVAELDDGSLLVGSTQEGVFHYALPERVWTRLPDWSADRQCSAIYGETNGILWIASKTGLTRIRRLPAPEPVGSRVVTGPGPAEILTFRQGFSTIVSGPETWVMRTNAWFRRQGPYDVPGNREAVQTALGEAIVAQALPSGLPCSDIRVVLRDSTQRMWFGTAASGLHVIVGDEVRAMPRNGSLKDSPVWSLFEDPNGDLWIGTGTGLRMLRGETFHDFSKTPEVPRGPIWQILGDHDKYLWLFTSQGLVCADRAGLLRSTTDVTEPVVRLNLSDIDGMPSAQLSGQIQPAGCLTRDGRIWVPTRQGVTIVDPRLLAPPERPPAVHIESVILGSDEAPDPGEFLPWSGPANQRVGDLPWRSARNGRTRKPDDSPLILPAKSGRSVLFRFSACAFADPLQARFRFRLVGHDPLWIDGGAERQAHYSSLRPGRYRFEVMAANRWNLWNREGAAIDMVVEERFSETPWFYGACGGLILASASLVVVQRRRRATESLALREAEREAAFRLRLSQDLHDDFGSGLARILMLVGAARQAFSGSKALEDYLQNVERVAHETSRTLSRFIWTVNARNDTVRGLITYCSRFAEEVLRPAEIGLRLDLPAELPETPLRSETRNEIFLTLKECLNNVSRHSGAKHVYFRLVPHPVVLHLEIRDDGRGLPYETRILVRDLQAGVDIAQAPDRSGLGGHGLASMFARLRRIGGELRIDSRPGEGTLVTLIVPHDPIRSHH